MSLRSAAAATAIALAGAATIGPAVASAKTVHFSITEKGKSSGPPKFEVPEKTCFILKSTWSKGKCASRTTPPTTKGYWKFKGGTIYYTYKTTLKGTVASGKGRITRGTGKFKGIKGTFKVRGDITGKFPFRESGTATY